MDSLGFMLKHLWSLHACIRKMGGSRKDCNSNRASKTVATCNVGYINVTKIMNRQIGVFISQVQFFKITYMVRFVRLTAHNELVN